MLFLSSCPNTTWSVKWSNKLRIKLHWYPVLEELRVVRMNLLYSRKESHNGKGPVWQNHFSIINKILEQPLILFNFIVFKIDEEGRI